MDNGPDSALDSHGQRVQTRRSDHGHTDGQPDSALTMDTGGGVYIPRQVRQGHSPSTLAALIGDAIRHGIDSARARLDPLTERQIIAAALEHIEIAGYTLVLRNGDER